MPLDRALRRRPLLCGGDDLGDLSSAAPRCFALQPDREIEHRRRRRRFRGPALRDQRLKPTPAPPQDPTINSATTHPDPFTVGARVITSSDRTHQHTTLRFGQRRIGGLADQRVTKQGHITVTVMHRASQDLENEHPVTLTAQRGAAQGQPVLDNNRPAVALDANDHGAIALTRNDPARAATPIASTASPTTVWAGVNGASIGSRS